MCRLVVLAHFSHFLPFLSLSLFLMVFFRYVRRLLMRFTGIIFLFLSCSIVSISCKIDSLLFFGNSSII